MQGLASGYWPKDPSNHEFIAAVGRPMIPITPMALPLDAAAAFKDILPAQTIDQLNILLSHSPIERGETRGGTTKRSCGVIWLDQRDHQQLYAMLAGFVAVVNAKFFRFDLTGLFEQLQLTRYEVDDCYDWHQDMGAEASSRKLSITIQLTDPAEYDGGDLEIMNSGGEILRADKACGSAIVFPSYQLHRVTPISRGVRHALVCWVSGPQFR